MDNLLGKAVSRALRATTGLSREEFAYRALPYFLKELITRYLRVTTEGIRHIPREGAGIVVANHSGYMGFDALMLGHQIQDQVNRVPKIIAHKLWFFRPEISVHAKRLGMVPATFSNGKDILLRDDLLLLFPEGEEGNFKPSRFAYRMRRFRRGFVRLALKTGAPIVPSLVIGAEETHITLSQIRWAKDLVGIIIPVPLNILPLPVKWHIKFFEPIHLGRHPRKADDVEYVTRLTREIRHDMQRKLNTELRKRKHLFL